MALTISISGYVPPPGVPLTMAALRKLAAGFAVSISGTVGAGEIIDGSVTPAKVSPGAYFYGAASYGAPNKYTVTLTPPVTGLANGVRVFFKAPSANLGGVDTTLVVNGLADVAIKRRMTEQLAAGEIMANQIVEVVYNSTGPHWELVANTQMERTNYALTTGTVASNRCTAFTINVGWDYVDLTQYTARMFFARLHADCNATPTMRVGTAAAKTLKWLDGRDISQSQLRKGQVIGFAYDSGLDAFVLLGEQPSGLWGVLNTGGANTWVASVPGYPESPVEGLGVILKTSAANTGAVTFSLTSAASGTAHGSTPVKKFGNRALDAGDVKSGSYVVITYDGTNWVLQTPTCQPVVMAMANFDGTASNPITPRDSYNIHGTNKIVKNGTGDYTINFATALPSANYQVHITTGSTAAFGAGGTSGQGMVFDPATNQLAGSVRIHTGSASTGAAGDFPYVYVTVIGYP